MSAVDLNHAFVSAKPDGADATRIRASNWNAKLLFSGDVLGALPYRDTGSATGASYLTGAAGIPYWSGAGVAPSILSLAAVASAIGLGNVENTALSTWAGSSALTTIGAATAASLAVTGALTAPIGATSNKTFLQAPLSAFGSVGHYNFCVGHAANAGDGARDDHVLTIGYNTTQSGGRANLTEPAFEWRIEDYYAPTASPKYVEAHWQYYDATGAGFRPIALLIDRANGAYLTNSTFSFTATALSYHAMNGTQYVKFQEGLVQLLNSTQLNTNAILSAGNITIAAAAHLGFTSAGWITGNQVNGQFLLRNTTLATGVGIDVSVDSVIGFRSRVFGGAALDLLEQTAPVGATNSVRIFAKDNGSGKSQLMAIFPTGAAVVLATEP